MNKFLDSPYLTPFFKVLVVFFTLLVLRATINDLLTKFWYLPILTKLDRIVLFDIVFLVLTLCLFTIYRSRAIKTIDLGLITIWLFFRVIDDYWIFEPVLENPIGLSYIDIIPAYYISNITVRMISWRLAQRARTGYSYDFIQPDLPLQELKTANKQVKDLFGRTKFATQLAEAINNIKPANAFVIGITGSWGAGKTSLIGLITDELKKSDSKKEYLFINYSPWFFKDSETILSEFFGQLEAVFSSVHQQLAGEIYEYAKAITVAEHAVGQTNFSALFQPRQKTIDERFKVLKENIGKINRKIIISIDDLDRLDNKEVVEVLRLIRTIADFPNTFYIVGYDKMYLNNAIYNQVTQYEYEKYADKIFNLEFSIPHLSDGQIHERVKEMIDEEILKLGERIGIINKNDVVKSVNFNGIPYILQTERDLKRFVNILMLRYKTIKEEVNFFHFFLLELLHYRYPDEYKQLYLLRHDYFSGNLKPESFDEKKTSFVLTMNALIKDVLTTDEKSLKNSTYFFRYFSLELLPDDFSHRSFQAAIEKNEHNLGEQFIDFNGRNSQLLVSMLSELVRVHTTKTAESVIRIIDGLLTLTIHISKQKGKKTDTKGLDKENIAEFIFAFIEHPEIESPIRTLNELVSSKSDDSLYGTIFSVENALNFPKTKSSNISPYFSIFRQLQLNKLVDIERRKEKPGAILKQIALLHSFVISDGLKNGVPNGESSFWFIKNIVTKRRRFLSANVNFIYHAINTNRVENNLTASVASNHLRLIFFNRHGRRYVAPAAPTPENKELDELFDSTSTPPEEIIMLMPIRNSFSMRNASEERKLIMIKDTILFFRFIPEEGDTWSIDFVITNEPLNDRQRILPSTHAFAIKKEKSLTKSSLVFNIIKSQEQKLSEILAADYENEPIDISIRIRSDKTFNLRFYKDSDFESYQSFDIEYFKDEKEMNYILLSATSKSGEYRIKTILSSYDNPFIHRGTDYEILESAGLKPLTI